MKKKEYIKPEMKVVHITPCAILAASEMYRGSFYDEDEDDDPTISDGWAIAD